MPVPVTLPRLSWGAPHAPRHALLIHGLGSNGALMWRYGAWLAAFLPGWLADAWRFRCVSINGRRTRLPEPSARRA